jgi:hypothetical protein
MLAKLVVFDGTDMRCVDTEQRRLHFRTTVAGDVTR